MGQNVMVLASAISIPLSQMVFALRFVSHQPPPPPPRHRLLLYRYVSVVAVVPVCCHRRDRRRVVLIVGVDSVTLTVAVVPL